MAITSTSATADVLSFEQYLAEGVVHERYDIIDGVRVPMPAPRWRHQRIQGKVMRVLDRYEERVGTGYAIPAPFDVLIRRLPLLQTRQPDVLFITRSRLAHGTGIPASGPLEVAPELVVEIISDSETEQRLGAKIADYVEIGVDEAWLVRPETRSADVVRLAPDGPIVVAGYREPETLQSLIFPDLSVAVAEFFGD
jgi:Uma2 family endonuclease